MLKIATLPSSLVLVMLALLCTFQIARCKAKNAQPLQHKHQTLVKFYFVDEQQQNYYWVVLEAEQKSDNYTVAINSLLDSIMIVENLVNEAAQANPSTEIPSIEFINNQQHLQNLNKLYKNSLPYELKLSELMVQFQEDYVLAQSLYIRINNDRKLLGQFVDNLQQVISQLKNGLTLIGIDKDSIASYYKSQKIKVKQGDIQEDNLIQNDDLVVKIARRAQAYCESLQLKLEQVLSLRQIHSQDLQEENESSETKTDEQSVQQMDYYDTYIEKAENQSNDFVKSLFEVKAKCTGNRKIIQKSTKNSATNGKIHPNKKFTTLTNLQEEIQKHKKKKIKVQ